MLDSWQQCVPIVLVAQTFTIGTDFVYCINSSKNHMDFDTFDTDIFSEINDAPGEIFDIPEMQDEKFDVEKFIEGDIDFWWLNSNPKQLK